jgi:hypothetical protein
MGCGGSKKGKTDDIAFTNPQPFDQAGQLHNGYDENLQGFYDEQGNYVVDAMNEQNAAMDADAQAMSQPDVHAGAQSYQPFETTVMDPLPEAQDDQNKVYEHQTGLNDQQIPQDQLNDQLLGTMDQAYVQSDWQDAPQSDQVPLAAATFPLPPAKRKRLLSLPTGKNSRGDGSRRCLTLDSRTSRKSTAERLAKVGSLFRRRKDERRCVEEEWWTSKSKAAVSSETPQVTVASFSQAALPGSDVFPHCQSHSSRVATDYKRRVLLWLNAAESEKGLRTSTATTACEALAFFEIKSSFTGNGK